MAGEAAVNPYAAAGSSILDFAGNSIMANSANAKSKRAVLTQFAMQNYFMDKQNEYNKPINQMARLREAGLNPNLVYGNGNAIIASSGASGGAMANITPSSGEFDVLGKMSIQKAMEKENAQIDNIEANTDSVTQDIDNKKQELELKKVLGAVDVALKKAQIRAVDANSVNQEQNNAFYQYLGEILGNDKGSNAETKALSGIGKFLGNLFTLKINKRR